MEKALADYWLTVLHTLRTQERIEREEILEALESMYYQYCDDGHAFMSAGESASYVLEKYSNMNFDEIGRILPLIDKPL